MSICYSGIVCYDRLFIDYNTSVTIAQKKSSGGTKLSARLFSKYTPQAVTVSDKPLEISIGPFQLIWEPPPWKMQITGLQDWKF